jgi:apolipoprotein N-acyltransferase
VNFIRQLLIALFAGVATVLAFAPFHAWPLALVSLVILFWQWAHAASPWRAAAIGFSWGLGLFVAGVSWLYVSLHTYGGMPAIMAAVAVFIFCMYLSLFLSLAGWLQARLHASLAIKLLIIMPAVFVASEYLRGWLMSGFPWLIIGYTQTPSENTIAPLAGFAPIFGVFGMSWLLAFTAGAIVLLAPMLSRLAVTTKQRRLTMVGLVTTKQRRLTMVGLVTIWVAGVLLQSYDWSEPSGKPLAVSLAQGNVAQNLKFREDQLQPTIDNYLDLVAQSRGQLIVLPETALPLMLDNVPDDVVAALQKKAIANNGNILFGIAYRLPLPNQEFIAYYNGAVTIGVDDSQRYAKQHLVAFGEFQPPFFSWAYRWLNIPMAGFTPGAETQAPMRLSKHLVAINICYEDTFGREIARQLPDAELLVNISNMAWYGQSLAADQHAQFSQMRALETSRWMLRATNTGVTAAINEKGKIVAALPQFTRGVLEVNATPRQGATPYVRWKDSPILLLLLAVFLFAAIKQRFSVKIPTK